MAPMYKTVLPEDPHDLPETPSVSIFESKLLYSQFVIAEK